MLTPETIQKEIDEILAHGDNRADIATLADLYICLAGMRGEPITVTTEADTGPREDCLIICGKPVAAALPFLEELVEAVQATNPRLYNSFMDKLA